MIPIDFRIPVVRGLILTVGQIDLNVVGRRDVTHLKILCSEFLNLGFSCSVTVNSIF